MELPNNRNDASYHYVIRDGDGIVVDLECRDFRVRSEFERTAHQLASLPPSKPLPSNRAAWLCILAGCLIVDALVVLGVVSIIEWLGAR